MQRVFNDILQGWQKIHPTSPKNAHCIGVATGSAYSGLMGHQKERREKLVGPVVNLAAHLCEQANEIGGGILVDQETMALVSAEEYPSKPIEVDRGEKIKCFQILT
jgi:class 3 adenylate cyclase